MFIHCIIEVLSSKLLKIVNILDPSPKFVGPPDPSPHPSVSFYMYMNSPGWPGCRCLRFCWFCSASESWGGSWPCSCCCFFFFICSLASSETTMSKKCHENIKIFNKITAALNTFITRVYKRDYKDTLNSSPIFLFFGSCFSHDGPMSKSSSSSDEWLDASSILAWPMETSLSESESWFLCLRWLLLPGTCTSPSVKQKNSNTEILYLKVSIVYRLARTL